MGLERRPRHNWGEERSRREIYIETSNLSLRFASALELDPNTQRSGGGGGRAYQIRRGRIRAWRESAPPPREVN